MSDKRPVLTTRQGHPVSDNQALRSVGERGPATLENYHFIEKITHFDRERVPERVVHARGTGAHGYFEAYGKIGEAPASKYTRARILNQTGVRTPVFVRFSTVIGAKESPETARDPRGFAVKLKTVEGNWGPRVAEAAGIDLEKPKALEPLAGKPAPHQSRPGCTYAGGKREEAAPARAQTAAGR